MYYFYKQGIIPPILKLPEGINICKCNPNPFVKDMHFMQMGKKKFYYYQLMSFIYRGLKRVFVEYDIVLDNRILSKAVVISKVPIFKFLPRTGLHVCYCETIPEARGKGYYPLLLNYIQNDLYNYELYMIVDDKNTASIKGIEKAGFIKYAEGIKKNNGTFVIINQHK